MSDQTPLPCPFCGKQPILTECRDVKDGYVHGHMVWCSECGIEMSDEYQSEVTANWNRRAGRMVDSDFLEVEPSDAERATWPDQTRAYVESLEQLLRAAAPQEEANG